MNKKAKFWLYGDFQRNKAVYLMAIPMFLFYIIFKYVPMGGLVIAFQKYNLFKGFWGSQWIGLENFIRFFTGPYVFRLIRNTVLINFYSIFFGFPVPIVFALMLNEVKTGSLKKTIQTISYMPHFISLVVVCGLINDFSRIDGVFNAFLSNFGLKPVNLLSEAGLFRIIFVGSSIWQTIGWSSIIYIATLSTVDPNLYDAAKIDGAGRLGRIIHISLPSLIPIITVQFIMRIGNILSVGFEKIILLYNPLTYSTADVISTYIYRFGLEQANYSFGTAVGIFNSIVNIAVLIGVNSLFRRFSEESLW
jgi:putative aldouronate transport system permease protein